ncbi:MAG TPA: S24 family peptidase [Paenalcaligenes sp.]|nr:S24 family peptidase [Paenalcaligenes sp.]
MMKFLSRNAHPITSSTTLLRLYGNRVSCGFPSPAQDHVEQTISLDALLDIQAPHIYIVRAAGDSMTGAGIFDDDWLIVDRSLAPQHGQIIIAALFGEPLVRRLYRKNGHLRLLADNPAYAPITLRPEDDFFVWGVVRHSIRRHCPDSDPGTTAP